MPWIRDRMGPEAALFSDQPVMPHRGLALPVRNWVVAAGNMFQCSLWLGWWTQTVGCCRVSMLSLVGWVDSNGGLLPLATSTLFR